MSLIRLTAIILCILFFSSNIISQSPSSPAYVPVYSDEEITARLNNLSALAVKPKLDAVVKSYIKTYSVSRRDKTERMLGKMVLYFPIFEKYLLENNMPMDIKYLSVVESALNPQATSRVGAAGLWQFMPATGQEYGLQISSKLDERRDPHKSTKAAINFLKRLYRKYNDWELALAAYNSGPGRVNRAIRRGQSKNFWKIKKYLPKETRNYVPAFVAANYIVNNYHMHYLKPQNPEMDLQMTDYTKVYNSISFREISKVSGTPMYIIQELNPSYKQGIIPSSRNGQYLTLPKRNMSAFLKSYPSPDSRQSHIATTGRLEYFKSVYYIQPGDNIYKVASLFNCHPQHIMAWNNLPQPFLSRGQELTVYQLSNSATIAVQKISSIKPKVKEKKQLKEETILSSDNSLSNNSKKNKASSGKAKSALPKEAYQYHYIRRNESIMDIVGKYPGVTIHDILRLNSIKGNDFPPVGTRLKIKKI